jgi:hypothetical protein
VLDIGLNPMGVNQQGGGEDILGIFRFIPGIFLFTHDDSSFGLGLYHTQFPPQNDLETS